MPASQESTYVATTPRQRRGRWPFRKRGQRAPQLIPPALHDSGTEQEKNVPSVYATPQVVTNLEECYFYHTMDIPGFGQVDGEWDMRAGVDAYLGGVDFAGKRVLEMGAASGFLTFAMEERGAEVVGYDLSPEESWDVVPMTGVDYAAQLQQWKAHLARLNKGFWLNHRAYHSSAHMVHGTVYTVPETIGTVDITTLCAILLHVRDPFLALQNALRLTRETVIITEMVPSAVSGHGGGGTGLAHHAAAFFVPEMAKKDVLHSWWQLTPAIIERFIGVLGFERTETTYHDQLYLGKPVPMYTVVGHRTIGGPVQRQGRIERR